MPKLEEKFKNAIDGTGIAEVIQVLSSENPDGLSKIAVQVRVETEDVPLWLSILDFVLQEQEEQDDEEEKWSAHCCKTYLRSEGKLGFVWSIALSSKGKLNRPVNDVCRAIRTLSAGFNHSAVMGAGKANGACRPSAARKAAEAVSSKMFVGSPIVRKVGDGVEVLSMPLVGVTANRNNPNGLGGKGAHFIKGD